MADSASNSIDGDSGYSSFFVSDYVHSMDGKRRFAIPTDWRSQIPGEPKELLVVPSLTEQCLDVYPARDFKHRMEKFRTMSANDSQGRDFARILASQACKVVLDNQGRVRVKDPLLERVGLDGQVALVGAFDHFELWSPDAWEQHKASKEENYLGQAAEYAGGY